MFPSILAYIGPGAGFAFLGSFLSLIASFIITLGALLAWPFRLMRRALARHRTARKAVVKRAIFLGFDGLDPGLTERFMAEGKLPNLSRLRESGSFHRLRTTFPPLSPVAWSTFSTGVNPAKHNIFDFLNRNLKSYVPELSSAKVRPARKILNIGLYRIPLGRPEVELRRKSRAFWTILGEHAISSTILRVPITFPPEKFDGRLLSAMCTPDLRGTQGSFTQFTTRVDQPVFESGTRLPLQRCGDYLEGSLPGPENDLLEHGGQISLPFRISPSPYKLEIGGETHSLAPGEYSPWIKLAFGLVWELPFTVLRAF